MNKERVPFMAIAFAGALAIGLLYWTLVKVPEMDDERDLMLEKAECQDHGGFWLDNHGEWTCVAPRHLKKVG